MISIIIPIYNVDKYLHTCLDSLSAQTFQDIEIILIDDGSTDNSGRIADSYTEDSRFSVYHTNNYGLSAARNLGIKNARGEWLMFVDSDDYVDKRFCEMPYRIMEEYNADLVIFQTYGVKKGKIYKNRSKLSTGIIDNNIAFEFGGDIVWNKLYKRELFQRVHFPEGIIHEDVATTYKIVFQAKRIAYLEKPLYYHVTDRKGSITRTLSETDMKNQFNILCNRYDDILGYGYSEDKLKASMCSFSIWILSRLSFVKNDELYQRAKAQVNLTKGIPQSLSLKKKIALLLWKIDERLFFFFSKAAILLNLIE